MRQSHASERKDCIHSVLALALSAFNYIMPLPLCRTLPLFTMLIAVLGGCSSLDQRQGEVMSATTVTVPSTWSTSAPELRENQLTPDQLASWWRGLGDEQLTQLIDTALTAAPDVRSAQARLRQARAAHDLAVAELYPTSGASVGVTRSRTDTGAGGTGKTRSLYTAGFDASWEPSIFGRLRDAAEAAEADVAASSASLNATRASLAAEVALEYVTLRVSQQRLAIVRANVESQAETLQITEWREMAGLTTHLDVEQARTSLEQSRAALPSLEQARAGAEYRLAVLTGQPPGSLREPLHASRPLPAAPDGIAVGIPADTLRQRPDVHAAEATLRAEIARTAQSEAERYPTLNLSGSFGWQAFSLSALDGGNTLVRSLAASLTAPLFDAGRISSRIARQTAVQDQAFVAWESSLLTALEDVENAMTAYAQGRTRLDARRRAAEAAANAAELARTQYQAGLVDFQSVLDTQRTQLSAQDNQASAEADVLTAVIQLYKALGGGWTSTANTVTTEPSRS